MKYVVFSAVFQWGFSEVGYSNSKSGRGRHGNRGFYGISTCPAAAGHKYRWAIRLRQKRIIPWSTTPLNTYDRP